MSGHLQDIAGNRKRSASSEPEVAVAELDLSTPNNDAFLSFSKMRNASIIPSPSKRQKSSQESSSQPSSSFKGSQLLDLANLSVSESDSGGDSDYYDEEEGDFRATIRRLQPFPDLSGNDAADQLFASSKEAEKLELQKIIDSIPLDSRSPVGVTRKHRLMKKKDFDADTGVGIRTFDDIEDIDHAFDDGMENEDNIELDRIKIEEAAKRIGCRAMVVKVTRREEIKVDDRGEVIAAEQVTDEGLVVRPAPKTNGGRGLLSVLDDDDDEEEMEVVSGERLGELQATRNYKDIVEEKLRWRVPGMRTPLLDHQVLGVDWMLEHELSEARPHGGLVADAMGLGKTIQAIATMAMNPPDDEAKSPQVTLIVAPLALLQQWKDEILTHAKKRRFKVFINHGKNKIKKLRDLKEQDVVLTTYNSLMQSCPPTKCPDNVPHGEYKDWFEGQWDKYRGIFHRMKFWRVILDEAHIIKNRRARTSIGCQRLDAEYTWCLSGTPIQNSLHDLFPIFSFIRHPTAGILANFERMLAGRDDALNAKRIQALLTSCNMRRTKNEILMGKRLITLPKKRVRMVELEFGEEERALYMAVEHHSRDVINGYIRRGTVTKHYSNILTMLLRLRQICNHPYLILQTITKDFTADDLNRALETGVDQDPLEGEELDMREFVRGSGRPKKSSGLRNLLEAAKNMPVGDISECSICLGNIEDPVMTRCRHVFCRMCITNCLTTAVQEGREQRCPTCRRDVKELDLKVPDGHKEVQDGEDWLDNIGEFMHSAKTLSFQDQLAEWAANNPGDKVVLFSQFTKMLDIVEKVVEDVDWGYCRYDGKMSIGEREESLHVFRVDPDTRIMLTSIKAGGVGLNLTTANLVISLDLWWNAATEMQAFDRVHRLGQQKEVFVTRFVVKTTVEERIIKTQEAKLALANAALGEGTGSLGKLSINKLMGLFGNLVRQEGGGVRLEADYNSNDMLLRAREAGVRREERDRRGGRGSGTPAFGVPGVNGF